MFLNARHIGIAVFGLACLLLVSQVIGLAVLVATRQASGESVLAALLALASLGLVVTSYRWTFIAGEKKWVVRAIWLLMLVLFSWITFIRVDVAQQIVVLIILLGLWMLVHTVR